MTVKFYLHSVFLHVKILPHQVVGCGKEGLHSTVLPLSLPLLPSNKSDKTKEEEKLSKLDLSDSKKKISLSKEVELTNIVSRGPIETSWSLSLSPWRVNITYSM